jgi:hypothetical protein|tara:strand:+ start:602 stop:1513 length:912 start_codon:yes stop_codon:yes gene_type:complete
MFKKYITKYFNRKNYLNLKSEEKIKQSIISFKKYHEEKILNIQKAIKNQSSLNFLHSGNLGDLIYSFSVIQELSKTHKCNFFIQTNKKIPIEYFKHPANGYYIDERMLNLFLPLIQKQTFITKIEKYTNQEIDIDLNLFRTLPVNICFNSPRWYFHITGVQVDLSTPYLEVDEHNELKDKIIIHRTFRHRNQFINYKFLKNFDDLYFIGTNDEYLDLKKEVPNLMIYECKDFLEMAQIIKSSKFFIGNQSIAYPMAEALKVPRLLEAEPFFPVVQPIGKNAYDFYYQPHFEKFFKILYQTKGD